MGILRAVITAAVAVALCAGGAYAKPKGAGASGTFDYYVLSLSWSPVYCESHPSDSQQCGTKRFGFVLHGLWPQYAAGGYPDTCSTSATLDENARNLARSIFPSEKLIAHEWTKHGTCSGMTAKEYFQAADEARNSIRVPDKLQPGNKVLQLRAQEISSLLRDANPKLTNSSLAVICGGQELSEVRVCLSKDLTPRACGQGVRTSCPSSPVRVPGVR